MKIIIFFLIFINCFIQAHANQLSELDVRKLAAVEAKCSKEKPCIITITKKENRYMVKVRKSTSITPEGILQFRTGSTIYYIYNSEGILEERIPTT